MSKNPHGRLSHAHALPRPSINPSATTSTNSAKNRHLSHLHSQLAQLSANMSDLENLLRMTSVQAEAMRGLGGWCGGLFMAASKVLGEETVAGGAAAGAQSHGQGEGATAADDDSEVDSRTG